MILHDINEISWLRFEGGMQPGLCSMKHDVMKSVSYIISDDDGLL